MGALTGTCGLADAAGKLSFMPSFSDNWSSGWLSWCCGSVPMGKGSAHTVASLHTHCLAMFISTLKQRKSSVTTKLSKQETQKKSWWMRSQVHIYTVAQTCYVTGVFLKAIIKEHLSLVVLIRLPFHFDGFERLSQTKRAWELLQFIKNFICSCQEVYSCF